MSKELLKFGDIEIKTWKYHSSISLTSIKDVDIDKVTIPDKFACGKKGFKHFIKMIQSHCASCFEK